MSTLNRKIIDYLIAKDSNEVIINGSGIWKIDKRHVYFVTCFECPIIKKEISELNVTEYNLIYYIIKELIDEEGFENNYGWNKEPFIGEEGGLYLVINKESGKKDFIKYADKYLIKDGMVFDKQEILPYISHWRKLDFKDPLH